MSRIVTLYSYKVGVGRTIAVANLAVLLAKRGKKILLMDWDLEAPGLHRYFRPYLPSNLPQQGIIHLLTNATDDNNVSWRPFVTPIQIENCQTLSMITSGDQSPDYIHQ